MNLFVDVLREHAERYTNRIALTLPAAGSAPEVNLTFGELDRRARAFAALLQNCAAPGERALLPLESEQEFLTAFLGCLYAGVVAVPTALETSRAAAGPRTQTIVQDASISLVLASEQARQRLEPHLSRPTTRPLIWLDPGTPPPGSEAGWQPPALDGRTLAFLQYTSGSTGMPRGAMVNHNNLSFDMQAIQQVFGYTRETPIVNWMPLFHDGGLILMTLAALFCGARLILISPTSFIGHPLGWLHLISQYRAYSTAAPNFAYDLCVRRATPEQCAGLDLRAWRYAITGAEPIYAATLERFGRTFAPYGFQTQAFAPVYGLAEATILVSTKTGSNLPTVRAFDSQRLEHGEVKPAAPGAAQERRLVNCGPVIPGLEVAIVQPEQDTRTAPGQIGEIWVSGPGVTQGYWNQPEATAHIFRACLADGGDGPFLRTGDLGFMYHGELFIAGRLKDLIIIRGQNHYPQDIEATVIGCHPALRPGGGAAFSVPVNEEERLVILHEVRPASRESLDGPDVVLSIRRAVAEQHGLAVYAIALLPPKSLPKTTSGKLQRFACRAAFLEKRLEAWAIWTETETSDSLSALSRQWTLPPDVGAATAQIWEEILGRPAGRPDDHFFDLGGDSLSALRLSLLVEERLGLALPLEFFCTPTLANLTRLAQKEPLVMDDQTSVAAVPRRAATASVRRRWLQRTTGRVFRKVRACAESVAFRLPYRAGVTWLRQWCSNPLVTLLFYYRETCLLRQFLDALPETPRSESEVCRASLMGDIIQRRCQTLQIGRASSRRELARCFNVPHYPFWQPFSQAILSADDDAAWQWPYQVQGTSMLEPFRAQRRGVIILTLHTHSIQLIVPLLYHLGFEPVTVLGGGAAPQLIRTHFTTGIHLDKPTAWIMLINKAMAGLCQGGLVFIVGDGRAGRSQTLEAPVYGRAYPFKTSFAELALRAGAGVIPMTISLKSDGQIRAIFHSPLDHGSAGQPHAERVAGLVQQYAAFLETTIQDEPASISFGLVSRYLSLPPAIEPNHRDTVSPGLQNITAHHCKGLRPIRR